LNNMTDFYEILSKYHIPVVWDGLYVCDFCHKELHATL
jgi:hypothetical protein